MRMQKDGQIQQVQERKEALAQEKIEKIRFDRQKWDLYRAKCDMIDDEYAEFKRKQVRIKLWFQVIMRDIMLRKVVDAFYDFRAKKTRQAQIAMGVFKIKFYIRRNLIRPRGDELVLRSGTKIRYIFTFL